MKKAVSIIVVVAIAAICTYQLGCRKAAPQKVQQIVVGEDDSLLAQLVNPAEVVADVYIAGKVKPVRKTITLAPGCWLTSKNIAVMPDNPAGAGVICDEATDTCEVIQ